MHLEGKRQSRGDARVPLNEALERFIGGRPVKWIDCTTGIAEGRSDASIEVVVAHRLLQDEIDYRASLQAWFGSLPMGGHLLVVVPHAFLHGRQLVLPSPWSRGQRRLYTPASLLAEVEEALLPNSYRVRWLADLDDGYDYGSPSSVMPDGESDVALVIERIAPPNWQVTDPRPSSTVVTLDDADFAFEASRTRVEIDEKPVVGRMLVLKLDHLGDLIMAVPALERLRRYFRDAAIDLVVGSWNVSLARDLGVADRVIAFDAFPRNSSEQEVNVMATLGQFRTLVTDDYDLAIDLRADLDTRILLEAVRARYKAAIGTRARFPFLDIALPLDDTRNEAERVRDERFMPERFFSQGSVRRNQFGLYSASETVERDCGIVWGPYIELDPGEYLFDFYLELDAARGDGLLRLDVALNRGATVAELFVSHASTFHLHFRVDRPRTIFEARIFTVEGHPSIGFGFHGGRLIKRGPGNVLHQTEYMCLLAELVKLRLQDLGTGRELIA